MKYLDQIDKPEDLEQLKPNDLYKLADEIREFIINTVSENGGHLSSNLGTVELTIALHKVFDFSKDRIVWDVGHQSYTHKILTGRKNIFHTLRKENGISGFPKTTESVYDAFNTGHSSTSVSAALGMARARDLDDEKYKVCAVIGDGALTGGMAFEGLNDVGQGIGQLLIILNDNEMSINKNVGAMSKYLNRIASKPGYNKFKKGLRKKLVKIPKVGQKTIDLLSRVKSSIKHLLRQDVIFDDLGIKYIGPVNGHDIKEMIRAMERANKIGGPVVLHVKTLKGMGYDHAEARPDEFHGIAPFDVPSGGVKGGNGKKSNSLCFAEHLCQIAANNRNVTALTAAMPNGTGLYKFGEQYPDRFFDVGIAEQHAVTMAAGMAMQGKIPCVAIYSTFMQRAFDQLLHDVALQNLHVVFGVDRAGVVGDDGETHQGIYDISYLNVLPNFTVFAPSTLEELKNMLEYSICKLDGPAAIRYPRKVLPESQFWDVNASDFTPCPEVVIKGDDITLAVVGDMMKNAVEAASVLKAEGISAEIINMKIIKPLSMNNIFQSVQKTGKLITIENNVEDCGTGERILAEINKAGINCTVKVIAFPNEAISHMTIDRAFELYGMDVPSIVKSAEEMVKHNAT